MNIPTFDKVKLFFLLATSVFFFQTNNTGFEPTTFRTPVERYIY